MHENKRNDVTIHMHFPDETITVTSPPLMSVISSDELDAFIADYTNTPSQPEQTPDDAVNAPSHYKLPGLPHEWIDVRSALLKTIPPTINYEVVTCWSEAITYLARCWGKNGFEDIAKAKFYIDRLLTLPSENQYKG